MKTQQIRAKVVEILKTCLGSNKVYYRKASDNQISNTPYIVYNLEQSISLDSTRDDWKLDIDVWGKMSNTASVDNIVDTIEARLNMANEPLNGVYPTFYRYDRRVVDDNDASIYRVQTRILVEINEN